MAEVSKRRAAADALDVSEYFIRLGEQEGDPIGAIKLQKLLYYAQGFHLALYHRPLFSEPIKAWPHGPVVEEVWRHYKDQSPESPRSSGKGIKLSKQVSELLDTLWKTHGCYSGWALRNMSHQEPPWRDTVRGRVISRDKIERYFATKLV